MREAGALRLLDEAEALCGPSFVVDVRRNDLANSHGQSDSGKRTLVPTTSWQHYEFGRHELRKGQFAEAAEAFQRSLDLRPQEYWPNFYHGLCSYRLARFDDAVADFQACLTIEPGSAVAHYNRAMAYDALGAPTKPIGDIPGPSISSPAWRRRG